MGDGDKTREPTDERTIVTDDGTTARGPGQDPVGDAREVGRYLIIDRLGVGGMGIVYAAYDPELDRKVALKLLHSDATGKTSEERQRRLQREAQAMARLSHPNVVAVHDVGRHSGHIFVAMEFVDGETLGEWLERKERAWNEIVEVFVGAARGLAAAHAAGFVHRDFKPDNVMVGRDARVRVMDFGLVRADESISESDERSEPGAALTDTSSAMERFTREGSVLGTPRYMAPEQFVGGIADARSDQFSFCVALWEALFGERPYRGENVAALAHAVTLGKLQSPPRGHEVPGRIVRAMTKGLSVRPRERWVDMERLVGQLVEDPRRGRRRLMMAAGGLTLLGAVAVGVGLRPDPGAVCKAAGESLEGVWDGSRRASIGASFSEVKVGHAVDTWDRSSRELDDWTNAWIDERREACLATHARGEQSPQLLDLRIACLDRQRTQLDALLGIFADPDLSVVETAIDAVRDLPDPARCGETERLQARFPKPDDAELAAQIEEEEAAVARAEVLGSAGKYEEALVRGREILERARALDYPPVEIEAAQIAGSAADRLGRSGEAEELWSRASDTALRNGDIEEAARASIALVGIVGVDQGRAAEGELWLSVARPLVDAADRPKLRLELASEAAYFFSNTGKVEEAIDEAKAGLGWAKEPEDAVEMSTIYGAVLARAGHFDEARQQHARAIELSIEHVGPRHPRTAKAMLNEGAALFSAGDHEAARERFEQVMDVAEAAFAEPNALVADGRTNLGLIELEAGRHESALEHFTAALEIYKNTGSSKHPNARRIHMNLAVLHTSKADYDQARVHFERALELMGRAVDSDDPEAAAIVSNYGDMLFAEGSVEEARQQHERAVEIMERALGPKGLWVAYPLTGLARDLLALGQADEALVLAERALEIREDAGAPPAEIAETRFRVAQALDATGKKARAMQLARRAEENLPSEGPTGLVREELEAWLAERN